MHCNMKNGEGLNQVSNQKEQDRLLKPLLESQRYKKKANVEVSKMLYLDQANLLITGSWDSTIKVFDCKDETSILRIMTGGH